MTHLHTSTQPDIFDLGFGHYTCNWGAHICGLYGSIEERDEILYGCLHAGLMSPQNFSLVGVDEEEMEKFYQRLEEIYPEDRNYVKDSKKCSITSNESLYHPGGTFSPWSMEAALEQTYENAKEINSPKVRGIADMIWAKKAIKGIENLMAYEARLNLFIEGKTWASICMYDTTRFSGAVILQALQVHPFVINNGVITENPFYTVPEEWLNKNAPQFLTRQEIH